MIEIDINELRANFNYDPETGLFIWKTGNYKGKVAGSPQSQGYVYMMYKRKRFYAHRAAIAYMTGSWPKQYVDHINLNPTDNRICNLRECTTGDNLKNRKAQSNNKLGVKGVHIHKGKYCATIRVNNKPTHIGYFDDLEKAADAYKNKALEIYGEFANF